MKYVPTVAVLLVFAWAACQSIPEPPPASPEAEVAEPPTVRIDPAEAANFARNVRAEVEKSPAEGLSLDLWATEQLLEDPIALDIDDDGTMYVTGSSRSGGLLDIRSHPSWTTTALSLRSVEDHEAFLKDELSPARSDSNQWLPDFNEDGSRDWRDLTVKTERLYKIVDTSGDGVADQAQILVEGFNTPVSDVLGGLLVHQGDIYVASAPDLWLLEGAADQGRVNGMTSISRGYGTHPGFFGHGMSGITVGPDGRLYWSVGDMGFNVVDREGKRWDYSFEGAILRSNMDGSNFEVYAAGLRNTHEFEFDEYGNLISVDNDGDHRGEMERLVYIVEGSDSGWRTNWQFGKYTDPRNNDYKVWMDEELFKPDAQAAYITPPIANYHAGPAGMAYNPGTALDAEWQDYFFVSAYTGSPANTDVYAFRLEEKGAGFELADEKVAVSGVLTVGMDFGPDGALYLADWIDGWASKGAGRIWKLDVPGRSTSDVRYATRNLLREDFSGRTLEDLGRLLTHPDLRVRQKAQFELAGRSASRTLTSAAEQTESHAARMHGLWGLWQLALEDASAARRVVPFLEDDDAEVRAQAAKILGDVRYADAASQLMPLLQDPSDRVRFFAAQGLGRMEHAGAFEPLVAMLEENAGRDTYLRHAGALALARLGDAESVARLSQHPSSHVRTAAVVALRRLKSPAVAAFFRDSDERVATEAARAANDDGGIDRAIPNLAAILLDTPFTNEALIRRVINANLRSGTSADANRLAEYARRADAPTVMRVEAVQVLGVWPNPSPLDRVDGVYLGLDRRDTTVARAAAEPLLNELLADSPAEVKVAAAQAAGRLSLTSAEPVLMANLRDDPAAEVRAAALRALSELGYDDIESAVRVALDDDESEVRMTAVGLIPSLGFDDETTAALLERALDGGSMAEQQSALAALGDLGHAPAQDVLRGQLDLLERGELSNDVELDLLEAASAGSPELQERAAAYRAAHSEFAGTLFGGDRGRGARVFFNHEAAQCTRCHAVGQYGGETGPNLTNIGSMLSREQLLEALVEPGARIAPGFGSGPSAMPPMGHILSKKEIRDVIEFLAVQE